jgi:hypothetical protein
VIAQRLDVVEDARNQIFGRLDERETRQAVRDAFVLFVHRLTIFATAKVGDGVLAVRFETAAKFVPKRFDITTPH